MCHILLQHRKLLFLDPMPNAQCPMLSGNDMKNMFVILITKVRFSITDNK